MRALLQRGAVGLDVIAIFVVLCVIIFLFILPSPKLGPTPGINSLSNQGGVTQTTVYDAPADPNSAISPTPTSLYSRSVSLSSGNGPSTYQPYDEYVTIYNTGESVVDITGWRLENARGQRVYDVGGSLVNFPSISAFIPKAAPFVSPTGQNFFQDVVLKPGETAIVTTGSIGNAYPYNIVSFKENECSGYLGNDPNYTFDPYLNQSCVPPSQEPGLRGLDVQCQDFIGSLPSCQTPKFDTVGYESYTTDYQGNTCFGCVNGTPVSSTCYAFIKSHFSYPGCLVYHAGDANFFGTTWRIFLNKPTEMWAEDHESISLFDSRGNLAAYQSY